MLLVMGNHATQAAYYKARANKAAAVASTCAAKYKQASGPNRKRWLVRYRVAVQVQLHAGRHHAYHASK